ncbi:MAG: translational GTPase TypA [Candidatus Hydrogenedentota bacterium]
MHSRASIRNLAIVAHIDHGKTTLIDAIFRATHTFRENARVQERAMDSGALERERGITIRSKHCAVDWGDYRINIVDTPGHADFSGEVERVLSMVDSVILLVDANEGPMPQTRYVLMRALKLGMRPLVVVNKVDRPQADPQEAVNKTFDLFLELGAADEQADFPVLYGSGLGGWVVRDLDSAEPHDNMDALFETIVTEVPPPPAKEDAPFRMQVSTLGWRDHIGRLACGRVLEGRLRKGDVFNRVSTHRTGPAATDPWEVMDVAVERCVHLWVTQGMEPVEAEEVRAGDIVWIAGARDVTLGDTLACPSLKDPAFPPLEIEEPTVSMYFLVNSGPMAGKEGRPVTLRQLKERLDKELRTNVALRVEDLGRPDGVKVSGRGELHLGILIEEMRREGMELCVSCPEVITHRDEHGHLLEPMEEVVIDVPGAYQGTVIETLAQRKAELTEMHHERNGLVRLIFTMPTRGLIGYRSEFLTDTRGLGIMSSRFNGYGPWRGDVVSRNRGSMISMEPGEATSHSLENLQNRGVLFISPMERVYTGMIVGENSRPGDLPCNPTKRKALTNHRAAGKDHEAGLDTPRRLTLDAALEWIAPDELVEVTPSSIRVRKAILSAEERKREDKHSAARAG